MTKYIIGIDGMHCGMCELHVEETLRRKIKVKRIKASHFKNEVVLISEEEITEENIREILEPTGYRITSFKEEEAKKKLFGWR